MTASSTQQFELMKESYYCSMPSGIISYLGPTTIEKNAWLFAATTAHACMGPGNIMYIMGEYKVNTQQGVY
jgi:hypothetical protein